MWDDYHRTTCAVNLSQKEFNVAETGIIIQRCRVYCYLIMSWLDYNEVRQPYLFVLRDLL
jgi:hypothetical protein